MIDRFLANTIKERLAYMPAVAILGPRQIGKTTIALQCSKDLQALYIDLGDYDSLEKFRLDTKNYLKEHSDMLVIIDEVQCFPDLFKMLRGIIDQYIRTGRKNSHFMLLCSASRELLKQSSESLAGRVSYLELTGIMPTELTNNHNNQDILKSLWIRGGFPASYTAELDAQSFSIRADLVKTFIEKDIPQLVANRIPSDRLMRLLKMLAHMQGEPVSPSRLAVSLAMKSIAVSDYIDYLVDLMLVRKLERWTSRNVKKQLEKLPRIFIRDSGVLHYLFGIVDAKALSFHPIIGKSWEGFVVESICNVLPDFVSAFFYRTESGHEIDLLLEIRIGSFIAIDIKFGENPYMKKGFHSACKKLNISPKYLIHSGQDVYMSEHGTKAMPLVRFLLELPNIIEESD